MQVPNALFLTVLDRIDNNNNSARNLTFLLNIHTTPRHGLAVFGWEMEAQWRSATCSRLHVSRACFKLRFSGTGTLASIASYA